jgi:hypothetical protein
MEPLTTRDVSITTATVDIAVIRVGAKQMTQSVFRQLPGEWAHHIDKKATPWGLVNYQFSKRSPTQWWVVELEGELWRVPSDSGHNDRWLVDKAKELGTLRQLFIAA